MTELPRTRLAQTPLLFLAMSIAVGILLGHYTPTSRSILIGTTIAPAGLTLICIWAILRKQVPIAATVIVSVFLATGVFLSQLENRPPDPDRIKRMFDDGMIAANEPAELTAIVQGQPETAPEGFYLNLRAESVRSRLGERAATGRVLLFANESDAQARHRYEALELRHGARIRVLAVLSRDEDYRNPGVMPLTEYLDRKELDATGVIKSPLLVERLEDERIFLPLALLYEWRERLQEQFARRFSPETAGVLDATLLGNHYNISRSAAERFRAGGTFHVLVISGLQIAFIGGLVLVSVRWFTRRKILQFVLAATFLWAYTIAVGADASVVRSAAMFTMVALAPAVWRRADTLNGLGAAAILLLVLNPNGLFDPSFQLTFLSVLSIIAIPVPLMTRMQQVGSWRPTRETPYPPMCSPWFRVLSEALFWSERAWKADLAASNVRYRLFKTRAAAPLERWRLQRLLQFATAAVVVSASVQVGMLPVLIIYFHRVSFASLLLNIFVGAAMAIIAFVALLAILAAQVSASAAMPFVWLAEKVEWLMVHAVDPFNRWGVAAMRLPHYRGWAAAIYLFYFLALSLLCFSFARWNPLRPDWIVGRRKSFARVHVRIAAIPFGLLLTIVLLHPFTAARADGELHVDFLDVGQGDCAVVTMPDGVTLMIDGGGRPNIDWNKSDGEEQAPFERDTRSIGEAVVSEYLWSRGLDRVDYIVPTHADADHIDGLNDVARNFRVRGAILARTPADDSEYARFARTMIDAGVPIQRVGAGDVLHFGNVTIDVVWPLASNDPNAPFRNNDGLVLRLRYGEKTFLFMADIEKETEAALLKSGLELHSDVIKVAHHGSRTSSIQSFVDAARPSLAIISVGRNSIFGHPHKEVIDRWQASGAQVVTTGHRGTISVVTDGRDLNVSTFVPQ